MDIPLSLCTCPLDTCKHPIITGSFPEHCETEKITYINFSEVFLRPFSQSKGDNDKLNAYVPAAESGAVWCATQVHDNGTVIEGRWGDCTESCPGASKLTQDKIITLQVIISIYVIRTWVHAFIPQLYIYI